MIDLNMVLQTGIWGTAQKTIEASDTAQHYGSGALGPLLATPAYVFLLVQAAIDAVDTKLPEGLVSVAHSMEFVNHSPTLEGMTVTVKATLTDIIDNRLTFIIVAHDNFGEIGYGKHERVILHVEALMQRALERVGGHYSCVLLPDRAHMP